MELSQVLQALRNADAAGDVEAARRLAQIARDLSAQQPAPAPVKPPETTLGGNVKEFFKGLAPGAVGLVESAAIGASALLPDEKEQGVRDVISRVAGAAKKPFEAAPGYEEAVGRKFGQAVGSIAPFLALGPAGIAGRVGMGALGSGAGAGEARTRAEQEGGMEQRGTATALGALVGVSEMFAPARILGRVNEPVKAGAVAYVRRALQAGGEEAAQEAAAQAAQNMIAKGLYKPEQAIIEQVGESAAYGGATGALVQGLMDLALGRRAKGAGTGAPTQDEIQRLTAEEEQRKAAEEARKATPEYAQEVIDRTNAIREQRKALVDQQKALPEKDPQRRVLGMQINDLSRELKRVEKDLPQATQVLEAERVKAMTPEEAFLERQGITLPTPAQAAQQVREEDIIPQGPVPETPAEERPSAAAQYAQERIALAQDQLPEPGRDDYVDYLAQNPLLAQKIVQENVRLPGFGRRESDALVTALGLRLNAEAKQALAERVSTASVGLPEGRKVGIRKTPDYAAYLEAQEELDQQRQEGLLDKEISEMERNRLDIGATEQYGLFPEQLRSEVREGLGRPRTEQEVLSDLRLTSFALDAARRGRMQQDDIRTRRSELLDELRAIRERKAAPVESAAPTELTEAMIGKVPETVAQQQAAQDAQGKAYADLVELITKNAQGVRPAGDVVKARDNYIDNLIRDVELTRGAPVEAGERVSITGAAKTLLNDLIKRFGDTRQFSEILDKEGEPFYRAAKDMGMRELPPTAPLMGYPTVDINAPGTRQFARPYLALQSIKEGLDTLRNRAVGSRTAPSITRTLTPEQINRPTLETQLERVQQRRNRLTPEQQQLLEQVSPNVGFFAAQPETSADLSNWLYSLESGQEKASAKQAVKQRLAERVGSDMLEQREIEFKPQRGAPALPEKAMVFRSPEEFQAYLASDALQQLRADMGLRGSTIQRIAARVAPFQKRVDDLNKQMADLQEKYAELEVAKRKQLDDVLKQSDAQRAANLAETKAAEELLEESRQSLSAQRQVLDAELQGFQIEYMEAVNAFEFAVRTSEDINALIEQNIQNFAQGERALITKIDNAQKDMRTRRFFERAGISKDRVDQRPDEQVKALAEIAKQQQKITQWTREWRGLYGLNMRSSNIVKFLDADLDYQMQLNDAVAEINKAAVGLLNAKLQLDLAARQQERSQKNKQALAGTKKEVAQAQEFVDEARAAEADRLEKLGSDLSALGVEKKTIPHWRTDEVTEATVLSAATDAERALSQALGAVQQQKETLTPAAKALEDMLTRRARQRQRRAETPEETTRFDEEQAQLERQAGDAANRVLVSFEGRRRMFEALNASTDRIIELDSGIEEATNNVEAAQAELDASAEQRTRLDNEIERAEKRADLATARANKVRGPAKTKALAAKTEAETSLLLLRERRDSLIARQKELEKAVPNYASELKTLQNKRASLLDKEQQLELLLANDPEVAANAIERLNKQEAKTKQNIANIQERLKNKKQTPEQRKKRVEELQRYEKRLRELAIMRDTKRGIERVQQGRPRLETQPAEPGVSLTARRVGPLVQDVRKQRGAQQGGARRLPTGAQAQREAVKDAGKLQATQRLQELEDLREKVQNKLDEVEARTPETTEARKQQTQERNKLEGYLAKLDKAIAKKVAEIGGPAAERVLISPKEAADEYDALFQMATAQTQGPKLQQPVDTEDSAAAVMNNIERTTTSPFNRAVAARLKMLLGATRVEIVEDLRMPDGTPVYGEAKVDGSLIRLDKGAGLNEQTALHEGVHAATERVLRMPESELTADQLAAKRELEELFTAYAADTAAPNENAKKNTSEFLSDALSDPEVQSYLQNKPWTLKNMWTALKNGILRMLGIETPSNMMEATLAVADRLMTRVPRPTPADMTLQQPSVARPKEAPASVKKALDFADKLIAKDRSWTDQIKANATGLAFETQVVDRFAGFERLAKYMDSLRGTQMMYYLRMYDQRMNFTAQAVARGAPEIIEKKRADGRVERVVESQDGPSIKRTVDILKEATPLVGSADNANRLFTMYMSAIRAKNKGLATLNFKEEITQDALNAALASVDSVPGLKDIFDNARAEYNAYNRNLIKFLASTGYISDKTADNLVQDDDYIPWYRKQGGVVDLIIGNESPIRIGNIASQPYLDSLVGGDKPILDFLTSSVQNTSMIMDMGLNNLATKNAVFELENINAAKFVKAAQGRDVVRFKQDGVDKYAVLSTEKVKIGSKEFDTGVPADILVKGMEGIPTQMPFVFRVLAMPAQLLRKAVTLSPLYMARQLFRDSLAAPLLAGADFAPVVGALKELKSANRPTLEKRGVVGGQQFVGRSEDLSMILRDITEGKPGWMQALGKFEAAAMEADALTRRAQYNSYIKQGMSEMEATLMALESMNFNKRGASPSIHMANALIPFFNAQIQGLNVLYRAMFGKMPFNDQLKIRQKMLVRGGMMAAATLVYAAMMEDDEAYKNAMPDQKYGNWFIRVPGIDEPVKLPIPFEIGYIFKALPEALYNAMGSDKGAEDAYAAFKTILRQTIPGGSSYGIPQAMKPLIEAGLGKSFYTGRDILSGREKEVIPEEQFRVNTSEVAKTLGKALDISPIMFESLVSGYTGTIGLAFLHALSIGFPKSEGPERAVRRLSEYPLVGGAFQSNDAGGIVNNTYERFNEAIQIKNTFDKMYKEGRGAEAKALLERHGNEMMAAELGEKFKQAMNKITAAERAIQASNFSPEEKRKQLDQMRKLKIAYAESYRSLYDKVSSYKSSI